MGMRRGGVQGPRGDGPGQTVLLAHYSRGGEQGDCVPPAPRRLRASTDD